jgi:hypothetical protein
MPNDSAGINKMIQVSARLGKQWGVVGRFRSDVGWTGRVGGGAKGRGMAAGEWGQAAQGGRGQGGQRGKGVVVLRWPLLRLGAHGACRTVAHPPPWMQENFERFEENDRQWRDNSGEVRPNHLDIFVRGHRTARCSQPLG